LERIYWVEYELSMLALVGVGGRQRMGYRYNEILACSRLVVVFACVKR
jgi:hypothetical protein